MILYLHKKKEWFFFGMTSNYCYLTEKKIPDFPQKRASWFISRQMLYESVKLDQGWEVSHLIPDWKTFTKEQWDLGVPDGGERRLCFIVPTALCLFCRQGCTLGWRRSTYILLNIFVFSSHSVLGLCCICYTCIFISHRVLLCISHALLFCLGLHRIVCPTKLICPIIALKILD